MTEDHPRTGANPAGISGLFLLSPYGGREGRACGKLKNKYRKAIGSGIAIKLHAALAAH